MKRFIRNLAIKQKLLLLLILPAMAALSLASIYLVDSWQQVKLSQQISRSINASVTMNTLLGNLQAERGATGVFLASSGERFASRLAQLREQTDISLRNFLALDTAQLSDVQKQMQQISELRRQINQLSISNTVSAERYTALISTMISENHHLETAVPHRSMALRLATLNQFIEMKERAGRERAILGLVFSRGSFNSDLLMRFSDNLGAYHAFADNFLRMTTPEQRKDWQQLTQHSSFTEVARLQQLAFETPLGDVLNVDDGQWFDTASQRLAEMTEFELILSEDIANAASQLYQQSFRQLWMLMLLVVLISVVLVYIAAVTVRSIAVAVTSIEGTIIALANRDLTARANYKSNDEFGRIATSTNTMADELQRVINEIGSATAQVATAAEQSSAVTLQTSKGVLLQQQDTEMVAAAMHEMSATVRDVASSTAEAAELSVSVQAGAAQGQKKLDQTISLINSLSAQVDSTAKVIEQVKHDSDAITSVLDVIRGIADQTNLLALNAAIEAARAGEQGRGFAVVADEVRTLAKRTAQSTGDIQRMIEGLQQGALKATDAMRLSLTQAQEGSEKVTETGAILSGVLSGINGINDKNMQIASAAEEQTTVAEEINQKVLSISDVSAQTSAGAEQTAATSRELASLAENLQRLVSRFKFS